jgi:hypothetical protein
VKRIRRGEHETVLDAMERKLDAMPDAMAVRRCTVEHVFGTIKGWMGATHFRTRGLKNVTAEASLAILANNIKRAITVAGVDSTIKAITGKGNRLGLPAAYPLGSAPESSHTASAPYRTLIWAEGSDWKSNPRKRQLSRGRQSSHRQLKMKCEPVNRRSIVCCFVCRAAF